jgi:hypothetical protein
VRRIFAIAQLTWKAAFRFRLFWVLCVLLLGSVVLLPTLIKHDGTARGFTQILLTYTLSVITLLLGLTTLWLSCGILAREVEDCQMQVLATKPIARWQIWLGKWLGVTLLNLALLALAGASVYALLQWRASQLPAEQRRVLRNEIFVSRGSLKPPLPDLDAYEQKFFESKIAEKPVPPEQHAALRNSIREQLKAGIQIAPPGYPKQWVVDLGLRKAFLFNQPLYIRAKFHAAQTNLTGTYWGTWYVGRKDDPNTLIKPVSLAADSFHEFEIPPNLFDADGRLPIMFHNQSEVALLFPIEDGLEVLYREGGFALNFTRGLLIVLFWLALLAALGLAAASFLSFPVAAFFSFTLLVIALSSGTLSSIVSEGTVMGRDHETGAAAYSVADKVLLPMFKGILALVSLVQNFSPVEALSTGRSIGWDVLARAFAQIVLLLGGMIAACGMFIFTRRELATAQGTQ